MLTVKRRWKKEPTVDKTLEDVLRTSTIKERPESDIFFYRDHIKPHNPSYYYCESQIDDNAAAVLAYAVMDGPTYNVTVISSDGITNAEQITVPGRSFGRPPHPLAILRAVVDDDSLPSPPAGCLGCGSGGAKSLAPLQSQTEAWLTRLCEQEMKRTRNHKVGVLLQLPGQETEEEMFGNKVTTPSLREFLLSLGEQIELAGWPHYSGGLNLDRIPSSFFQHHESHQTMFHVSTMLPFKANDPQQLERKRHIGNDNLVLVFQEGPDCHFDVGMVTTQMIKVYIVVQRVLEGEETSDGAGVNPPRYRVQVAYRGIRHTFGPALPGVLSGEGLPLSTNWLVVKVLNGGMACWGAPELAAKVTRLYSSELAEFKAEHSL
eukprot:gnl/Dysnectes_brevis/552_a609_1778.p1 GENE.gnl/Dysnectes_brevis/552_a609_1778~~gnl/Dysnectes_brevis/552_a609_1778.p1  ORF type:complete len:376 (-),score=131.09 gnl/Dysnectes_brevis/552_a609_1778:174-1301(-)